MADRCDLRDDPGNRASENALYRDIIDNAPIGIYKTTPAGRVLMANRALLNTLGFSSFDEIASRNIINPTFSSIFFLKKFINLF